MRKQIRERIAAVQRNSSGTGSGTAIRNVTGCSICRLPNRERERIDRELLEGQVSLGIIANRVPCAKSSVKRHLDRHVRPAAIAEIQRIEHREPVVQLAKSGESSLVECPDIRRGVRPVVARLYEKCVAWADRAQEDSSWPMFVAMVREARQSAELYAKLSGELHQGSLSPTDTNIVILMPAAGLPLGPVVDVHAEDTEG